MLLLYRVFIVLTMSSQKFKKIKVFFHNGINSFSNFPALSALNLMELYYMNSYHFQNDNANIDTLLLCVYVSSGDPDRSLFHRLLSLLF